MKTSLLASVLILGACGGDRAPETDETALAAATMLGGPENEEENKRATPSTEDRSNQSQGAHQTPGDVADLKLKAAAAQIEGRTVYVNSTGTWSHAGTSMSVQDLKDFGAFAAAGNGSTVTVHRDGTATVFYKD